MPGGGVDLDMKSALGGYKPKAEPILERVNGLDSLNFIKNSLKDIRLFMNVYIHELKNLPSSILTIISRSKSFFALMYDSISSLNSL